MKIPQSILKELVAKTVMSTEQFESIIDESEKLFKTIIFTTAELFPKNKMEDDVYLTATDYNQIYLYAMKASEHLIMAPRCINKHLSYEERHEKYGNYSHICEFELYNTLLAVDVFTLINDEYFIKGIFECFTDLLRQFTAYYISKFANMTFSDLDLIPRVTYENRLEGMEILSKRFFEDGYNKIVKDKAMNLVEQAEKNDENTTSSFADEVENYIADQVRKENNQ